MRRKKLRKMVLLANLLAISIVLNIIESFIPILTVPGAKIGFANIATLIVIFLYGAKEGVILTLLRIFLVAALLGTFLSPAFYLSVGGAVLSLTVMVILKRLNYFGIIGISVLGSVFHSIGQILIGIPVIGSNQIVYWLPVMLLISIPAGFLTGVISSKFLNVWQATHNEKS